MAILAKPEAGYFCSGYRAPAGIAQGSFRSWSDGIALNYSFSEGTARFDELRDMSLGEVERLLFMAASLYRRSFDLQLASASNWAHVTLYYGSYFSAQALLGIFGTWKLKRDKIVLEPDIGTPGSQRFTVRRIDFTSSGPHRQFWEFFYNSVQPLSPWIEPQLRFAIAPISGNPFWQAETRNELNYDSHSALQLMGAFQASFRPSKFRVTLPSVLNTQFQIMEALLQIAVQFCTELRISTDALHILKPAGNRRSKLKQLVVFAQRPSVDRFVRKSIIR